ncbi:hypothetical protein l11_16520 [Neisseria weaveri LMG 5135]|nr:hypothetical protein l13_06880 [Neisseria weaveri ATCC 51223]EGV36704.1 hypothetical protein l11_16520 [Neisseria weaveri LMG 5135]
MIIEKGRLKIQTALFIEKHRFFRRPYVGIDEVCRHKPAA